MKFPTLSQILEALLIAECHDRPGVFCQSCMPGSEQANLIISAGTALPLKSTGNTELDIIEKEEMEMKTVSSGQPGDFRGH